MFWLRGVTEMHPQSSDKGPRDTENSMSMVFNLLLRNVVKWSDTL